MKFIFLMTHLGSGSHILTKSLNLIPSVCCTQTNKIYTHPTDLDNLRDYKQYAKTFIETVTHNHCVASKSFYDSCKFIYFINSPKQCFKEIRKHYSPNSGMDYYSFRLRRMYELAHYTKHNLFLTYEQLAQEQYHESILKFIDIKKMPSFEYEKLNEDNGIPDDRYQKYLSLFNRLNINKI